MLARKRKIRSLLRRGRRARRARFPTCGVIRVAGYSVVWDYDPTPISPKEHQKERCGHYSAAALLHYFSWCASEYSVVDRIIYYVSHNSIRTNVKRIAAYEARTVNNENTNSRVRVHKNKVYAPALHELIHYRKLPPQLLGYFENKRYINDYNVDGWMEIDSKIAQIYMRTLAEYSIKCSDKDIVLGTDTFTHSREIYSPSRNHANLQAQCCKINIENCLPQPSMDVRFEDILEFKSKRKDELNAFRAKIRELEINIYNADSPELIRHYETQFIEEWQQCSQDYYKALKDSKLAFFLSSLVSLVGIPFVGQQLSTYIGQDVTPLVQTGAQLLKIGIGYFDYRNKISPAKADGGFSYIIKANRDGIIHI